MNIQELIELGKPVLAKINEDAGSEGLKYKAYFITSLLLILFFCYRKWRI